MVESGMGWNEGTTSRCIHQTTNNTGIQTRLLQGWLQLIMMTSCTMLSSSVTSHLSHRFFTSSFAATSRMVVTIALYHFSCLVDIVNGRDFCPGLVVTVALYHSSFLVHLVNSRDFCPGLFILIAMSCPYCRWCFFALGLEGMRFLIFLFPVLLVM